MPNNAFPLFDPRRVMPIPFYERLRYRPRKRLTLRKKRCVH